MTTIRGTLVSFNAGSHTAVVRLDGSTPASIANVKTARNIAAAEMSANRKVLVDAGETGHGDEYVVIAVFT
jgi:hypothetical protein